MEFSFSFTITRDELYSTAEYTILMYILLADHNLMVFCYSGVHTKWNIPKAKIKEKSTALILFSSIKKCRKVFYDSHFIRWGVKVSNINLGFPLETQNKYGNRIKKFPRQHKMYKCVCDVMCVHEESTVYRKLIIHI
jgi:hypothetical protein